MRKEHKNLNVAKVINQKFWSIAQLIIFVFALYGATPPAANAQSTFGSIVGTVRDAQGALIAGASVTVTNTSTAAVRTAATDGQGAYSFPNVDAGAYVVTIEAPGFEKTRVADVVLQAREYKRVDATLQVGVATQSITVEGQTAGVVNTDESSIAQTKTGRELIDLPVGLTSRSSGSTSPFSALSTEPGVQAASNTSMVIAGATPALQSVTIDGISSLNVANPLGEVLTELSPSFNAISEIRISESNMNAEFSNVVDVTTTTKGGGNQFHGGLSENYESKGLNADDPFAPAKPNVVMNDFAGYVSGPLLVPHFYDGHGKTFFFGDYEGLRLPQSTPVVMTVPTVDMRAGNICAYLDTVDQVTPGSEPQLFTPDGTQIPCNAVPVSQIAANAMKYLYPLPNSTSSPILSNFSQNFPTSTSVNQGDVRIDQTISTKQTVFGRFTYKRILSLGAPSNAVFGSTSNSEIDEGFVAADNYIITPHLINELRIGANGSATEGTFSANGPKILSNLGITGIADVPSVAATPNFGPGSTESSTDNGTASAGKSHTIQLFDNLTWVKSNHTLKFGADVRRLADNYPSIDAFGSGALGVYVFNGTTTFAQTAANPSGLTGDGFAEFLLGYPDSTQVAESTDPGMSAWAYAWAFYGQDTWNVTKNLTLNFGIRYEVHPPLEMHGENATGFLPNYESTINGVQVHGAVIVPNAQGLKIVQPAFAASIAPTPILTAAQVHLPTGLRVTDKVDFGPRIGFAWRPFHDDKTVIRGGGGRFIEPPMGGSAYFNWAIATSNNPTFQQGYSSATGPTLTFPDPFTGPAGNGTPVGSQNFEDAFDPNYQDPVIYEWNLTVERDLGHSIGLRVSYTGNHGTLLDYPRDLNQIAPNTTGYDANSANRPYPLWNYIDQIFNGAVSNYNSLSGVVTRRFSQGLQFQSSYTFTRDLSDAAGAAPRGLASVGGAGRVGTYAANPRLDYGNVTFDRRHRLLSTFVYELPFGAGKRFFANSNWLMKNTVGGWELAGILVDQSGSFLTLTESKTDPSGTGQGGLEGNYPASRVDVVPGVSPHLSGTFKGTSPRGTPEPLFLNRAAFSTPPSNIGRFANEPVGYVTGPGEHAVSLSALKSIQTSERVKLQIGCSVANLLNHRNYGNPSTNYSSGAFGTITSLQPNESGGPRFLQLTGRLTF